MAGGGTAIRGDPRRRAADARLAPLASQVEPAPRSQRKSVWCRPTEPAEPIRDGPGRSRRSTLGTPVHAPRPAHGGGHRAPVPLRRSGLTAHGAPPAHGADRSSRAERSDAPTLPGGLGAPRDGRSALGSGVPRLGAPASSRGARGARGADRRGAARARRRVRDSASRPAGAARSRPRPRRSTSQSPRCGSSSIPPASTR